MKPQPSESFQNLKITQVEMPPNLFVYGQPVNLHPAYQYDHTKVQNPQNFLPVVELNKAMDPLVKEDSEVKASLKRLGACFYFVLCILAFLSILGIIRTIDLINTVMNDDSIPRVIIGFIVCNLIEDFLIIACIFPTKQGIYNYNYDRMVLSVKIIWGALLFFIISNICYIIYSSHYHDSSVLDHFYLGVNLAVGICVFISLLWTSRPLFRLLLRIKQIQETIALRAHI